MNFAASKVPLSITGPTVTGGPGSNVGNAAQAVNLSNVWKSNRANSPKFDEIGATAMAMRSNERATAIGVEADVRAQGIASLSALKAAKIQAEGQKDAAQAEAKGSMIGSALGAAATIGSALIFASDESTKDNIEAIDDALSTLRQLRPVSFNYKEEWSTSPERVHHGFIAQEYQKVMPDATYYDEEYQKLCIDTVDLIGLLVRSIQQLETKVTRLEAQNALVGV